LWDGIKGALDSPDKVWLDRIFKAFLNKYRRIYTLGKKAAGERLKKSDQRLALREMANVSAHSAALMVDRAGGFIAAMMQFGGISYEHGITMVDNQTLVNTVENAVVGEDSDGNLIIQDKVTVPGMYEGTGGLIPILNALASKDLVQFFFDYERALRAHRIRAKGIPFELGKNKEETDAAIRVGLSLAKKHPEIAVAHRNLQNWNDSIVNFLEQTGVLTPELAANWRGTSDYIPFYLDIKDEGMEALKKVFTDELSDIEGYQVIDRLLVERIPSRRLIKGTKKPIPLMEPIEAISKNALALVTAGLKNVAVARSIRDASELSDASGTEGQGTVLGDQRQVATRHACGRV